MHQKSKKKLSIIIPVFNEQNYLLRLFKDLKYYFNSNNVEIIIVDEGSTDQSTNIINKIKKESDFNEDLKSKEPEIDSEDEEESDSIESVPFISEPIKKKSIKSKKN